MHNLRFFIKLYLSYALLLLLPLGVLAGLYAHTSDIMARQAQEKRDVSVQMGAELINRAMQDIQAAVESVILDESLRSFISAPSIDRLHVNELYLWKDALRKHQLINSNIADICLLSYASNYLLTAGGAAPMEPIFFEASMAFTGMSLDEWNTFIGAPGASGFHLLGSEKDAGEPALVYVTQLHVPASRAQCYLAIHVNTATIRDILAQLSLESGSLSFATTGADIVTLSSTGLERQHALVLALTYLAENSAAGYIASEAWGQNGWRFVSLLPVTAALRNVRLLSRQIAYIAGCILVVGLLVCYVLTRNRTGAMARIFKFLNVRFTTGQMRRINEFTILEAAIAELVHKNEDYDELSERQQRLLGRELLRRLMLGEYHALSQMESLLQEARLELSNHCFSVVMALEQKPGGEIGVAQFLEIAPSARVEVFRVKGGYALLLILPGSSDESQWLELSDRLVLALDRDNPKRFRFCVSALHRDVDEIHRAYDETAALNEYLRSPMLSGVCMLRFDALSEWTSAFYHYPVDLELQLMMSIKLGDQARLDELFTAIYQENFENRRLSVSMIRQLSFALRGTVLRVLHSAEELENTDGILRALYAANTIDDIWATAIQIGKRLCDAAPVQRQRKQEHLAERIRQYLDEHYAEEALTLPGMARDLDVSERMLYDFIRLSMGTSFAKLLESLRIHKACELMRLGTISVKGVAERVGYSSDNTFRAAFKRVMRMTPSEYLLSI